MSNPISNYFSEFKILKGVSRDFWLTNAIQFFDGLAYFSMITVLSLYLTVNCGLNDLDSGKWVGFFTLFITVFVFAVGSICDVIGIRRSYLIGIGLLALARLGMGMAPRFLDGEAMDLTVKGLLILLAVGTAFMSPVTMAAMRRFTTKANRATGFNVYYLLMNVGAIIAHALVIDGFRKGYPGLSGWLQKLGFVPRAVTEFLSGGFGQVAGNLAILDFGFIMSLCALVCVLLINENNFAEESERDAVKGGRRPLAIFLEVWKERAFQKLLLFLVLTIGVRLVFTHQFLVMPKYYTRVMTGDFDLGMVNAINPTIIVLGLILLIPVINRYSTVNLVILGMSISAASLLALAVPLEWVLALPFIHNVGQAYFFIIVTQLVVFAIGELIFSPRFTEYIASVAPPDKVSSYMALSALPTFISKPINGFVSGILISRFCYEGIRPKIETGNVDYGGSPEFMWMVYLILAVLSPIAVVATRNFITSRPAESAAKPAAEA